jgi:hypothetical protein
MVEPIEVLRDFHEGEVAFWHSDETSPFLTVRLDMLKIYDDKIEVYSRDYKHPIAIVYEYDFWKELEKEWPDKLHASHKAVRSSDASTFDFICDDCGARDSVTGGWGSLKEPCRKE